MSRTIRIDLPVLPPKVPDSRETCVRRVVERLLAHPGIDHVHVIRGEGSTPAQLCIHYHSGALALARIKRLIRQAGAAIGERCRHLLWPFVGGANRRPHIERGASSSAAGTLRVELDREATDEVALRVTFDGNRAPPDLARAEHRGRAHRAGRRHADCDDGYGHAHGGTCETPHGRTANPVIVPTRASPRRAALVTDRAAAHRCRRNAVRRRRRRQSGIATVRTLGALAPLAVTALLFALFYWSLKFKSDDLPSPLLGKSVPEFSLPPVQGRTVGLSSDDLVGEVSIVNVFASWCVPCRDEHPLFTRLARQDIVPINGINYKDEPRQAEAWLAELGDPYARTGADIDGRVGIDWGVYGVPETFVVDADGRVAYKHVGPLSPAALEETILPLVARLQETSVARETTSESNGSGGVDGEALTDEATR